MLDAGCGEGVLVEEYAGRLAITGVDPNYSSPHVRQASLLDLPFEAGSFDRALCLDVLEHLTYEEQPRALRELHRVLKADGELLVSVPNLAHLQSRVHFLLTGRLIRTASEQKHPGDRPIAEYLRLFTQAGFTVDRAPRHLPDRPGAHRDDPPQPRAPRLAPPHPHRRAPGRRLGLLEHRHPQEKGRVGSRPQSLYPYACARPSVRARQEFRDLWAW